ncbi:AAA family ATPase [Methanospirillum stamsii]|uniref:Carbon monoxide dehydrogenase n=1 Tax=Methanospirillum stamsii TaxID=1277351 RepID=A0A2V2NIZ7_9EURY|nr:AAA family ATPase [Methanospirillum stamsii]PWR76328.1 carbon monoxide dehydrogenase [Methanospirillum stamsii]
MSGQGFRVVITGKGGVGKTTITSLLSHLFAQRGYSVLAVDEDPQMNLPYALGVPAEDTELIVPLSKNLDYIEEKTGARPDSGYGLMLSLNPDVSDVVERFGMKGPDGVNILVMGTVVKAATGCLCPENTLLDAVMRHINLREGEIILMDTQAGVEHFGRALAKGFNQAILVADPTFNSLQVVKHAAELARELGIPDIHLVINRVRSPGDIRKVNQLLTGFEELFSGKYFIPYDEMMIMYDPDVRPMLSEQSEFVDGVRELQMTLEMHGLMRN